MIRIDSRVRSTSAREVTISHTNNPSPYSAHKRRNAEFVIPAIGESTTGEANLRSRRHNSGNVSLTG